jgi:hypothetical protein
LCTIGPCFWSCASATMARQPAADGAAPHAWFFYATETAIYTTVTAQTAAVWFKKIAIKSIKPNLSNQWQQFTARFVRFTTRFLFLIPTARTTVKKPWPHGEAWRSACSVSVCTAVAEPAPASPLSGPNVGLLSASANCRLHLVLPMRWSGMGSVVLVLRQMVTNHREKS